MGRKFLDEDRGPLTTEGFRGYKDTIADFELMCAEIGKSKSEVYRELMEDKLRRHHNMRRLRERAKKAG